MSNVIDFITTIARNVKFSEEHQREKKSFLSRLSLSLHTLKGSDLTLKSLQLCRDRLVVEFSNDSQIKISLRDSSICWHYNQVPILENFSGLSKYKNVISFIEDMDISLFIGDIGAKWISNMLPFMINLKSLDLDYNKIGFNGAVHIFKSLETHPKLKNLNLSSNQFSIGIEELNQMLRVNTVLECLNLIDVKNYRSGNVNIFDGLKVNSTLKSLSFGLSSNFDDMAIFSPTDLTHIGLRIAENKGLTKLSLKSIGSQIDNLLLKLLGNQTLKELNIQDCTIKDEFSVFQNLSQITSLSTLTLKNVRMNTKKINNYLLNNTSLKSLSITDGMISNKDMKAIYKGFGQNKGLTHLDISNNYISHSDPICEIIESNESLTSLSINNNRMKLSEMEKIVNALNYNDSLIEMTYDKDESIDYEIYYYLNFKIFQKEMMLMLRKEKDCILYALPRRLLVYLLGFL
jgi:hypothetical protein